MVDLIEKSYRLSDGTRVFELNPIEFRRQLYKAGIEFEQELKKDAKYMEYQRLVRQNQEEDWRNQIVVNS